MSDLDALTGKGHPGFIELPSSIITVGPIRVDTLHNEVSIADKKSRLTPTESMTLHFLAVNANNVCTASQIVSHVWGFGNDGDTGLVKSHIRHLRQKIEPDPNNPIYILTVPDVGYTLVGRDLGEAMQSTSTGEDV